MRAANKFPYAQRYLFGLEEIKAPLPCLIHCNGYRPIVGSRGFLADPSKQVKYVGHLTLPKSLHHKHTKEMGSAFLTPHCSQANTLESDMAMEWDDEGLLTHGLSLSVMKLGSDQKEEILNLKSKLKLTKKVSGLCAVTTEESKFDDNEFQPRIQKLA
uniref:Uncharacterized protein n=1 Tax=Cucumis melo TaxID=3656 RepID=A0A9I9E9R3_CUCME